MSFHVPEKYRFTEKGNGLSTDKSFGNNGCFLICTQQLGRYSELRMIASDGDGWEHVSASFLDRCPSWAEMCEVKNIFWDPEDCVVQFHPPESQYVNCHPFTLHLWRKVGSGFETPPGYMIGPRDAQRRTICK